MTASVRSNRSLIRAQACEGKSNVNEQMHWADGFVVVYDISDKSSFLAAKTVIHLIREQHLGAAKRYRPGYGGR